MHPAAAVQEESLTSGFRPVTDPQERLSLILAACSGEGIPEPDRMKSDLVPGCASRVWLAGWAEEGALRLQWDADSPLVRGLAGLICQIYDGVPLANVTEHRSRILTALGLDRSLSPTRLRGLGAVEQRIHAVAAELSGGDA